MNTTTLEQAAEQATAQLKAVIENTEIKSWYVSECMLEQAAYAITRAVSMSGSVSSLDDMLDRVECGILRAVLEETKGNETQAAVLLQKNRGTIRQRIAKHQLGGGV